MFEFLHPRRARRIALFLSLIALTALVAHAKGRVVEDPVEIVPPPNPLQVDAARIEVAFVLDTTGSMSGLIEGAKQKIWSIANQLASGQPKPQIRMALVGYRDRGDRYVTRRFDLTGDVDAIYGELMAFHAEGGGDTPESVNQALHEAVTKLDWSRDPGVYRVIFLVGDAPPHMDYQDDVHYERTVELARRRDIVLNTIQCGGLANTTPVWQQIARGGQGQYASIAQDGAMVALVTPMDDELAQLNRELAETVLPYGAAEEKAEIRRKVSSSVDAPASVAASRLAYLDKSGGRVNSGRSDLVDAIKEGLVKLGSLAEEALPSEMQPMAPEEREAFVELKLDERRNLQGRIAELSRKRDAYLRAESERLAAEGEADGFDQKVLGTIRTQAAEKGISYE